MFEFREELKDRTKKFALRIIHLCQSLPQTPEANLIGNQILRSGTSVGANYRAACRARSNAEFFSKISIVIEEADETMFWLELLQEAKIMKAERLTSLYEENEEILRIMAKARMNSKKTKKYE
jgi:four helix bundle protein